MIMYGFLELKIEWNILKFEFYLVRFIGFSFLFGCGKIGGGGGR